MFNLAHALKLIKTNDIDILNLYDASYIDYQALPNKIEFNISPIDFGVINLWINVDKLSDNEIICTSEQLIIIFNISEDKVSHVINNDSYIDRLLCVTENRFLTADRNNQLKLWDGASGKLIRVISIIDSSIKKMILLPNSCIATSSYDNFIRLWYLDTGTLIPLQFKGHNQNIEALHLHNNRHLYSNDIGGTIRVWDVDTGECLKLYEVQDFNIHVITLGVLDEIIAATLKGAIYNINQHAPDYIRTIKPFNSEILSLSILPNGSIFAGSQCQGVVIDKACHSIEQFFNLGLNCCFSQHTVLSNGKIVVQDRLVLLDFPERDINFFDVIFVLEFVRENKSLMTITLPNLNLSEPDKEHYKYQISKIFENKPEVGLVINSQTIHKQDVIRI